MNKDENNSIETLSYEIENQELEGKSGSGWSTAIQLTLAGKCGKWFTGSYECTTNNVSC
ncbi:salivaricin M family lantibiotic [Facklamia hominis]|uniref:salivaricin M family lantibiotic n=1 Tax=Facklamia hominis TaxID=178214 RepID=UPI0026E809EF|nr:salivaricin M family lantibiotic [Anaerococcus sp.]